MAEATEDVIRQLIFKYNEHFKQTKKSMALKTFVTETLDELLQLWQKAKIPTIKPHSVRVKMERLIEDYYSAGKYRNAESFVAPIDSLFDIASCKCNLIAANCRCKPEFSIPETAKEFIIDQRADRKMTIPHIIASPEPISTSTTVNTPTASEYIPETDMANMLETDVQEDTSQTSNSLNISVYGQNYTSFAIECDRFGISDRAASALASALFSDVKLRDNEGNLLIIVRNKVRREREKARQIVVNRREQVSSLVGFSFDSRKDKSRKTEKKDDRYYPSVIDENHVAILKEPNSVYLGHECIPHNSKAADKAEGIIAFFEKKKYQHP